MSDDPFVSDPALARAAGYPYDITAHSFTFIDGEARPFDRAHTQGRLPVVGYGSNQSPIRLRQKYGTDHAPIPVQRAWLADHDVVFSAHISGYGSVPAALRYAPGTRVAVAVTWLSEAELAVMHPTETDHYDFARLADIRLSLDGGDELDSAFAYLSFRGHVGEGGLPFALAEIRAEGRSLPALRQLEMQALVRDRLSPEADLAAFVRANIDDAQVRRERIARLEADAVAVTHAVHAIVPV
jgi:hypothetical protein